MAATVFEIDLTNLDAFAAAMIKAPETFLAGLANAFDDATNEILGQAKFYPAYPGEGVLHLGGDLPGGFYTEKQRGFVLASLRDGTLQVPYTRTFDMQDSWTRTMQEIQNGFFADIRSDSPYVNVVQDSAAQASMFDGYWTPVQDRMDAAGAYFEEIILGAVDDALGKVWGQS